MPKISAVMALYNTPYNYLKATVESILTQKFDDFEFIVIDDASTIDYEDFFKKFDDERIKHLKLEKNSGPGAARNAGIRMAKGEYVAIVDSDDIYMPQRFELQAKFLDENPDISLIGGSFRFSNKKKISPVIIGDKEIKTHILFNSPFANPLMMFRRDVFVEKNLFYPENINFGEDYELWISSILAGVKMANLKDFLMIYTRRSGQLSKAGKEKQISILKKIYKKMFLMIGFDASREELDFHYNLYSENFHKLKSPEIISDWFDKIIHYNRESKMFDEQGLIDTKNQYLEQYEKIKNRLLKVKISGYNFCVSRKLKIYVEERD